MRKKRTQNFLDADVRFVPSCSDHRVNLETEAGEGKTFSDTIETAKKVRPEKMLRK